MRTNFFKRALQLISAVAALSITSIACQPGIDPQDSVINGTVKGVVTDNLGTPLEDVQVKVKDTEITSITDVEGMYTLENVPVQKQTVVFTKEGYASVSSVLNPKNFNSDNVAVGIDAVLDIASAVIYGKCLDSKNANAPMSGVAVTLNGAEKVTTDNNGAFRFENLTISNYNVLFQAPGCVDVEKKVLSSDFTGSLEVNLGDIRMGDKELLRGLTADDLKNVDVWHFNSYRGGKNGDDYPHFDWSTDYLSTLTGFYGDWEEQNEGTTLRIRNSEDDQRNPADLKVFDSFLVGRKMITADNCNLTLKLRTHDASTEAPAHYGVQVIDLSAAEPETVMIGEVKTIASDRYTNPDVEFDLSAYKGKEVAIAIGIFRAETGDYWKQLVIRRIAFVPEGQHIDEWGWLPGTPVAGLDEGYKMTQEMVRSTMPVTETYSFTGYSDTRPQGSLDGPQYYREAYMTWRKAYHFAAWWSCMPVRKDMEPFANEGYVIKTNGGGEPVNMDAPQAYFYSKFPIASGHDKLTLRCRTFQDEVCTFWRLTAITEDGTVTHLKPSKSVATTLETVENNMLKLAHVDGGIDNPEGYATIDFDLSSFDGKNVVLAIAVFKGEANDYETKLCINHIAIN